MNKNGKEIERKWFLACMPPIGIYGDCNQVPLHEIEQFYFKTQKSGTELRVRREGAGFSITEKSGNGLVREETEIAITKEMFLALQPLAIGSARKRRFFIPHQGRTLLLDQYLGPLQNLVILECEFSSKEESAEFVLPDWAQVPIEVTESPRFSNKLLALNGFPGAP